MWTGELGGSESDAPLIGAGFYLKRPIDFSMFGYLPERLSLSYRKALVEHIAGLGLYYLNSSSARAYELKVLIAAEIKECGIDLELAKVLLADRDESLGRSWEIFRAVGRMRQSAR